jgi:hypothetical protein
MIAPQKANGTFPMDYTRTLGPAERLKKRLASMVPVLMGGLLPLAPGFWSLRRVTEAAWGREIPVADVVSVSLAIGAAACLASIGIEQLPAWLCRRWSNR